jgi:trk system potassium uptake protein TrkH
VIYKYLGTLCLPLAVLTMVPLGVSLVFGAWNLSARYAVVVAILGALGLGSLSVKPTKPQMNESLVLIALVFLLTSLLMTIPMTGAGLSFVDAFFEAVSGATTTGLSTLDNVEAMPATFLFGRAWMQWYGGLGIVILSVALIFSPGGISKRLADYELERDNLAAGTRIHARRVVLIYSAITAVGILILIACNVSILDAILYTMAAVSTGGFSPHNASLAGLNGLPAEVATTMLSFAGSVPLLMYYALYRKRISGKPMTAQLTAILIFGIAAALLLGLAMATTGLWSLAESVRYAPVMAFSAQTTAGFSNTDITQINPAGKLVLMAAMFIGGGSGSTAGGIKVMRFIMILGLARIMIMRLNMAQHATLPDKILRRPVKDQQIRESLIVVLLFLGVDIVSWGLFLVAGYDPLNSLFEVVSAAGTVGLSAGLSSSGLPDWLKLVLCLDMLVGRLEIVPLLVLVTPRTWVGRRLKR